MQRMSKMESNKRSSINDREVGWRFGRIQGGGCGGYEVRKWIVYDILVEIVLFWDQSHDLFIYLNNLLHTQSK